MLRNRNTVQNTLWYLYSPNAASRRLTKLRGLHCGNSRKPLEVNVYQGSSVKQHSTTNNTQDIKQSHVTLCFGRPLAHLCTARCDVDQSAPVVSLVRPISARRRCRSCLDSLPLRISASVRLCGKFERAKDTTRLRHL